MKIYKIALLVFFLLISISKSQEQPLFYVGGYGGYNYNIHWANFQKLDTLANCCPNFKSGSGGGFNIGALIEYPLMKDIFLGARLGVSSLNGFLSVDKDIIGNTYNINDGLERTEPVTVNHSIDAKIFTIGIEPYLNYKFFGVLNSYIGFNISYALTSKMDQKEELIKPDYVTFLDRRLIQNDYYDIDIPGKTSLLFFGIFGLGYDLPLTKSIIITPEIKYSLPLNNIVQEDWKISTFQFGAALKIPIFPPRELPVIYDTVYVRDTTFVAILNLQQESVNLKSRDKETDDFEENDTEVIRTTITEQYEKQIAKTSLLEASIEAVGIKADGTRTKNPSIVVEEIEVEEGFPLLPYIFFNESSSDLTKTGLLLLQKEKVSNFAEDSLEWNTMDIYSNLLNIVGYRLKQNASSNLQITGCNNNTLSEQNNIQLSKDRALAVKKYFVDVWGISDNRLKTSWQNLPDNPGNANDPDGIVENQRSELKITDNELIKPVYLKDIQRTADPPVVAMYPVVKSDADISNYDIKVEQESTELRHFEGKDLPSEIIWQLEEEPMPRLDSPINIKLNAKDELGQTANAQNSLKLSQLTIKKKRFELKDDKRIERFFLIVFDFNSVEIKQHHKPILNDIKSRIMPNSKVIISGYTDRTGDAEYNLDLAKRRCIEVQKFLKVSEENLVINPVGNQTLLYDNDIPQGRSYCRTVQVIIETPVE